MKNTKDKTYLTLRARLIIILAGGVVGTAIGFRQPIAYMMRDPEHFAQLLESSGFFAPIVFIGLVALQIVVAFIPGEPLELAAGYVFGAWGGTALCLRGSFTGSLLVWYAVKFFGFRVIKRSGREKEIFRAPFLKDQRRMFGAALVWFLIPGTPKDVMCWRAPLTGLRLPLWLAVSTFARLPSIMTSTFTGQLAKGGNILFSVCLFAVTAAVSGIGLSAYNKAAKKEA